MFENFKFFPLVDQKIWKKLILKFFQVLNYLDKKYVKFSKIFYRIPKKKKSIYQKISEDFQNQFSKLFQIIFKIFSKMFQKTFQNFSKKIFNFSKQFEKFFTKIVEDARKFKKLKLTNQYLSIKLKSVIYI